MNQVYTSCIFTYRLLIFSKLICFFFLIQVQCTSVEPLNKLHVIIFFSVLPYLSPEHGLLSSSRHPSCLDGVLRRGRPQEGENNSKQYKHVS